MSTCIYCEMVSTTVLQCHTPCYVRHLDSGLVPYDFANFDTARLVDEQHRPSSDNILPPTNNMFEQVKFAKRVVSLAVSFFRSTAKIMQCRSFSRAS